MLNWLRENVVMDRVHSILGAGCFMVARVCAAMIVVMAAAFVSCGCAKGPAYPPRSEVHAALLSATWGIKVLGDQCEESAMTILKAGDNNKALWFAQTCDDHINAARAELGPALEEIEKYDAESYRRIGCHLTETTDAYVSIGRAVSAFGFDSVDVEDGQKQAKWLVTRAGSCK